MRFFPVLYASLAFAIAASATASDCQGCFNQEPPKSCQTNDVACLCKDPGFLDAVKSCMDSTCSAADLVSAVQYATAICNSVNVSLPPSITGAANNASVTTTAIAAFVSGSSNSTSGFNNSTGTHTGTTKSSTSTAKAPNSATVNTIQISGVVSIIAAGLAWLML